MSDAPKRFYEQVTEEPSGDGFVILLDGRPAKTRSGNSLVAVPPLVGALRDEWDAQGEFIRLETMPLSRIHGALVDSDDTARVSWAETVLQYAGRDLLCYRAEAAKLAARQETTFAPFMKLAAADGIALEMTSGILPIDQPAEALEAVKKKLDALSPADLFIRKLLTEMTGSAVLALYADRHPDEAFAAARLDETVQAEQWGLDAEAEAKEKALRAEYDAALQYLALQVSV
ncbi:MAG: ATP12 family protein [Pseudomonadota bacterium]